MIQDNEQQTNAALLELPLPERTVCLALKHIQDKIKELVDQQAKQIQKSHLGFIGRFKEIQRKASLIIQGQPIQKDIFKSTNHLFTASQVQQKEKIMKSGRKLEGYWKSKNQALTKNDEDLLVFLQDIETNVTQHQLQLIFTFAHNTIIKGGKYKRVVKLVNGQPNSCCGDKVVFLKDNIDGMFKILLNDHQNQEELQLCFQYFASIINELVPYSLQYYLGLLDNDESQQNDVNQNVVDQESQSEEIQSNNQ